MDPLLHVTLLLSRWTRRRWTRGQAIVALCFLFGALAIGISDWLGYLPDWMTAQSVRHGPKRL